MADSFTEVSSQSWFSRLIGSIVGIGVGFVLFLLAIALLWWNEGNSLETAKSLKEGAAAVVDIAPDKVDPANEGRLVHVTGKAVTDSEVGDDEFAVSAKALRLTRNVEMYQWTEKESSEEHKKLGGGTETVTTYTYSKNWADSPIESANFKHPEGHENPAEMLADSVTFTARDVTLGAFTLPDGIVDKMTGDKPIAPKPADFAALSNELKEKGRLTTSGYYFGNDPVKPAIGDTRVTFTVLEPGVFSILAQQTGLTFQPYATRAGKEIERVESGSMSAPLMFKHAQDENRVFTWLLRLAGFVLMFIGFALIFKPLSVIMDVLPFLGDLVGAGTGLVAFVLALVGSLVVIALAWLAVRPLLGGTLLVLAIAALVWGIRTGARRKALKTAAA
jgi:hypothetical protein